MTEQMSELSLRPLDLNEELRPASMENLAAEISNNDSLASLGMNVLLVHAHNDGGSQRWAGLASLGEDLVHELAENDIGYAFLTDDDFASIYKQLDGDLVDETLLTIDLRLYKQGCLVARYSNERR